MEEGFHLGCLQLGHLILDTSLVPQSVIPEIILFP